MDKQQVLDEISVLIGEHYLLAETAGQVVDKLGEGVAGDDAAAFAETVQAVLTAVSQDQHLRFWYAPEEVQERANHEALLEQHFVRAQRENFGFKRVEVLAGNVGLVKVDELAPAEVAGEVAAAALAFVGNTAALIFDLRENEGGSPTMAQLLVSYLVEGTVELSGIQSREGEVQRLFTLAEVEGERRPTVPVYLLVSGRTHSAAEALAYDLQALKRATIVGERTRGGAHLDRFFVVDETFILTVPVAQAVNPLTGGNWERVGVRPDVAVPAAEALAVAHRLALEERIAQTEGEEQVFYEHQLRRMESERP